ncbi:MAG: hypothetical protein AABY22_28155, partial [Nanoarchaeota archaeon]
MPEKDLIFESKIKYVGIFSFKEFYKFCYDWLVDESGLKVIEKKYEEKIIGDAKNIESEWEGTKKVSDYFKFEVIVKFKLVNVSEVEVTQGGAKVKANKGEVGISVKAHLIKDYDGKWEVSPFKKFLRGTYEKYIIPSRVEQ